MRRFEEVTAEQLMNKIQTMRGTEFGDILCEWLNRYREGCRSELEIAFGDQTAVTFNQGRIDAIKEISVLLTPQPSMSATPLEPDRRLPWRK
jgi:hypothetical protein